MDEIKEKNMKVATMAVMSVYMKTKHRLEGFVGGEASSPLTWK